MKQKLFTAAAFLAVFAFLALVLAAPLPLMERSDEVLYTQVMPASWRPTGKAPRPEASTLPASFTTGTSCWESKTTRGRFCG